MRTFLLAAFAAFAAFVFAPAPASAGLLDGIFDVDIRSGGYYGRGYGRDAYGHQIGSSEWAEARFVHNHRSPIRRLILPYVAEYATNYDWQGGHLAIPGLRTIDNRGYTQWATRINGYDVNVNARVTNRTQTYSTKRVEITLHLEMYGRYLPYEGRTTTIQLIGVQNTPGVWDFYPARGYRYRY